MTEMIAIFDWHDWLPLFPVYFEQTIKAIAEMSLAGFNFVRQQRDSDESKTWVLRLR